MSIVGRTNQVKAANLPLNGRYEIVGGQLVSLADNVTGYVRDGYNANDLIYSVVNIILEKIKMAPWAIYKVKDESSLKKLRAIQSKKNLNPTDKKQVKELFVKALEVVNNPGKWGDLLNHPNEEDTIQNLVVKVSGFRMLTGNGFLWGNLLEAGVNKGIPQELWAMHSQNVVIKATRGFPSRVLGYQLTADTILDYAVEEVMHIKYPNFSSWDIASALWGMAPLKAACMLTNQMNSSDRAATAQYQNGGLQHIIFVDEPNLTSDDREAAATMMGDLKKKLISKEYSGPDATGKIAGSNYKMGAIDIGLSNKEMAIIEQQKWGLRRFCNIFGGVPSQTLNDPDNKTYNTMKEGEVALTTRGALPQLNEFRDGINKKAHKDWMLDKQLLIDYDATVYSELQDDVADMMKWVQPMAKLTGISPNRILDLLGQETIKDPYYDQPRVYPEMGESKSDFDLSAVDNALQDETGVQ